MNKLVLCLLIVFLSISCSNEENNETNFVEETELAPIIEITIDPNDEIIPYNSDVTINWTISNATSASLDNEPVELVGSKLYSNIVQDQSFEIVATNITKSDTVVSSVIVGEEPVRPMFFNLTFTASRKYFSTDGSMTSPVSKEVAQNLNIIDKIDITYTGSEYAINDPGFMDPITRSTLIPAWHRYHEPWLIGSTESVFYSTHFSREQFSLVAGDESKIDELFSTSNMIVTDGENHIPDGSVLGREHSDTRLYKDRAYAFKNKISGKRGLIYIHTSQDSGWPFPGVSNDTKVWIIRER